MLGTLTDLDMSDAADLCNRVESFLLMQHIQGLKKLIVEAENDTVEISGNVSTYYERQVAVECCKRVAGVRNVVDHIVVETPTVRSVPVADLAVELGRRPR